MVPAISQTVLLQTPLKEEWEALSGAGWQFVELSLAKLHKELRTQPLAQIAQWLETSNLKPVAASYQTGLVGPDDSACAAQWQAFEKNLVICRDLMVPVLTIAADYYPKFQFADWARASGILKKAAQKAAEFGIRLAFEFRSDEAFCRSFTSTLRLLESCEEPNLGLCLDWFHFMKGSSKEADLQQLDSRYLFQVQVSDVPGLPVETMSDMDRILPLEGDFPYETLREALNRIQYQGPITLELWNPTLWKMKPTQVAEICRSSLTQFENYMKSWKATVA